MNRKQQVIRVLALLFFACAARAPIVAEEGGFPEFTVLHNVISRNEQSGVSRSQSKTFAQRADGSTAERIVVQDGAPEPAVMTRTSVVSVRDGTRVESYREMSLKSTYPLGKRELSHYGSYRKPEADCSSDMMDSPYARAETEKLLGFAVVKFGEDLPNRQSEMFRAPDLGCYTLLRIVHRKDAASGKITDVFRDEVHSVVKGPPDPGLFDTKLEGYSEGLPSQVQASIRKKYFPQEPDCSSCRRSWDLLDQRYYAARARGAQ